MRVIVSLLWLALPIVSIACSPGAATPTPAANAINASPTAKLAPAPTVRPTAAPTAAPTKAPAAAPATKSSQVYYANCAAARAAGAAPLFVGEPGYRAALDRDRDGVACE